MLLIVRRVLTLALLPLSHDPLRIRPRLTPVILGWPWLLLRFLVCKSLSLLQISWQGSIMGALLLLLPFIVRNIDESSRSPVTVRATAFDPAIEAGGWQDGVVYFSTEILHGDFLRGELIKVTHLMRALLPVHRRSVIDRRHYRVFNLRPHLPRLLPLILTTLPHPRVFLLLSSLPHLLLLVFTLLAPVVGLLLHFFRQFLGRC